METFLSGWTLYMERAGYLEHTTAKREDCILSIQGVVHPIQKHLEEGADLQFPVILKNFRSIADFLVATSKNHRSRGLTAEMFFGCFKTLIHAVEDIILAAEMPDSEKLKNYVELRRVMDAMETIAVNSWDCSSLNESTGLLAEKNRTLTLDKNKYENIFEATSDIVLVVDGQGKILEMNIAARDCLGDGVGGQVLDYMKLSDYSFDSFIESFPYGEMHEVRMPDGTAIYSMVVVPLKTVSLASAGYVIILNDITNIVDQRVELEKVVSERTDALRKSEKLFRSLFTSAGEGIILMDKNHKIVQANGKAADMFGLTVGSIEGKNCVSIIHPDSIDRLYIAASIEDGDVWHGELNGVTASGDAFPASITVNKLQLGGEYFLHLIIRNITSQKAMEEYLRQEKTKAEEMNVTLRNVMKAIDREKEDLELSISQKVTASIIPSVQKLAAEENSEVRAMYLSILRDQLAGLTRSSASISNDDMMRLTRSEIQVCQMIQSGATSKDIADTMNISFETVQTHRKNIRKKLGLSGKDVNLFAYLNK